MDPATITQIILAAAQVAKSVAPLISQAEGVFTTEDADKIKAAIAELQTSNEALHTRVQQKLRGT